MSGLRRSGFKPRAKGVRKVSAKRQAAMDAGTHKPKARQAIAALSPKKKALQTREEAWRSTFHERAGGVCEWCESSPSTQVHHLFERSTYRRLVLHPANGLAVCAHCHGGFDEDLVIVRKWWAKLNPAFAALYAETPDVAAILHREAGGADVPGEAEPSTTMPAEAGE